MLARLAFQKFRENLLLFGSIVKEQYTLGRKCAFDYLSKTKHWLINCQNQRNEKAIL
jgi:hypothetical protein